MKSLITKIIALVLALTSIFSLCVVAYADPEQEEDFICGGVILETDVKIIRAPLKSKIVFGNSEPNIEGMVIKVTYPDGKSETLTVEKIGETYYAGDFHISIFDAPVLDFGKLESFIGFKSVIKEIYFCTEIKNQIGYSDIIDFVCFKIPAPAEFFQNISDFFSMIFA